MTAAVTHCWNLSQAISSSDYILFDDHHWYQLPPGVFFRLGYISLPRNILLSTISLKYVLQYDYVNKIQLEREFCILRDI